MGDFPSQGAEKGGGIRFKFVLVLVAIVLVAYFLAVLEEGGGIQKGEPAPLFTLPSLNRPVTLQEYQGKTVLLNFWATWCPPCLEEMPSLERLRQMQIGHDFDIIAIGVDDDWDRIRQFLKKVPVTLTILLDQRGEAAERYGVSHLPVSYLIDREGVVLEKYIGPRVWDDPDLVSEINSFSKDRE